MGSNQKQQYQLDDGQQEQGLAKTLAGQASQETEEVVPGVPVIRSSTPRPLSFDAMTSYNGNFQSLESGTPPAFPERAPSAPPLPEELGEREDENQLNIGMVTIPSTQIPPSVFPATDPGAGPSEVLPSQSEQNTDPLPAVKEDLLPSLQSVQKSPALLQTTDRSLVVFALYLVILLLIVLTFAVLQGLGFGHGALTSNFAPLGVPWLVIMYGLLGGCVSSIITLGHWRIPSPPLFVLVTWFVRPYLGAVLAIFAYILLTSGVFMLGQGVQKHMTFFCLIGVLAGLCEGWIFFRQK